LTLPSGFLARTDQFIFVSKLAWRQPATIA
jgi:hypothetical protein